MAASDLDLLRRALDQAAAAVDGLGDESASAPTPCSSWTVAELMDHLLNDLTQFTRVASGGSIEWGAPTPHVPQSAWSATVDERAQALADAWSTAEDTSGLGMQLAELAVHTWDLTTATGQPIVIDDHVAQRGLDWMSGMLKPEFRGSEADGKSFGPEVEVADDAPAIDRLVAFSGRHPH